MKQKTKACRKQLVRLKEKLLRPMLVRTPMTCSTSLLETLMTTTVGIVILLHLKKQQNSDC